MKQTILLLSLLICYTLSAQVKLVTRTATISFASTDDVFNNVKATNTGVTCVLNPATGEIAALALTQEFQFKIALMQEHFNETYIESSKYPQAIFRGTIENFDVKLLQTTFRDYNLSGTLELHGIKLPLITVVQIKKTATEIQLDTQFTVNSTDYGIKIPTISKKTVNNGIEIKLSAVLSTAKQLKGK